MNIKPKVSICVPFHWMENWPFFLERCLRSIEGQTFKDYEVILTKAGSMPVNTNRAIQCAKGEIIKILYMDDRFATEDSLAKIVENFKGGWLATGCVADNGEKFFNPHKPRIDGIISSELSNTIGSPSVIAFENNDPLLFDENMTWVLDIDYYMRLYQKYGMPTLLDEQYTIIGSGDHQMTKILTNEEKDLEVEYLLNKWK